MKSHKVFEENPVLFKNESQRPKKQQKVNKLSNKMQLEELETIQRKQNTTQNFTINMFRQLRNNKAFVKNSRTL